MKNASDNQLYCQELVRTEDKERYLVSLFAPAEVQRGIWAVLAFNQELAKIRANVSEGALGEIRLQWWTEVLADIKSGKIREHPVIAELGLLKAQPHFWEIMALLHGCVEARRLEMFGGGAANFQELETYVESVGGKIHDIILLLCLPDQAPDEDLRQRARAGGASWAMLGLIRALPASWQYGASVLPVDADKAMQIRDVDQAFTALKPMIKRMRVYIEKQAKFAAGSGLRSERAAKPAMLQLQLLRHYLKVLNRTGNNPFELPPHEITDFRKLVMLLIASITKRF